MKKIFKSTRLYWIIGLAVVLLAAIGYSAYRFWYLPSQRVETETSTMYTATARRGDITLAAVGSGTLVSAADVNVSFDISDGVEEELADLLVEVGDQVEQGDVLARLDDSNREENLVEAQRALRELTSPSAVAELEMELAQEKIDLQDEIDQLVGLISLQVYNAEKYVDQYTAEVKAAQAAVDADPTDENQETLKTAQQNLRWAKGNLITQQDYYQNVYLPDKFTQYYWDNDQKVYYINAPSDAKITEVRASIDLSKARIDELQVVLDSLKNGEDLPEEATGSEAAAIRQAQQAVMDAQHDLEGTDLISPISGIVTEIDVNVSDMVGNDVAMVISDLTPPTLDSYFDESDWADVQVGLPVEVTFDALPDKVYQGQVVHVDPGLVTQNFTTVVHAKVELDTSTTGWGDLPVGSAAEVDVIGGKAENAVLVPVEALHEVSDGEYAVFVVENGQPHMQLVDVGLQDLVYAEIKSGLNAGDVVTTGVVETTAQ